MWVSVPQELDKLGDCFADAGAGLGLHEMRCLVREASNRCCRLGLNYVSYLDSIVWRTAFTDVLSYAEV